MCSLTINTQVNPLHNTIVLALSDNKKMCKNESRLSKLKKRFSKKITQIYLA